MSNHGHLPEDLAAIASRLEAERPIPTGAELDRALQRATAGAAGSKRTQSTGKGGRTMRPRLAIVLMLTIGALLMAGGTGLAVSGISGSGDAGIAQYGGAGGEGGSGGDPGDPQAGRQAGADDDLPFTGYAAIPLILVGIGALAGGLVLRRRAPTD